VTLPSLIKLPFKYERGAPPFEGQDIKYPESLVRFVLEHASKPKQKIFDPFAGLGTTLFVAEEMGRIGYGIEYDIDRYQWSAGQLENWSHLQYGDAANMAKMGFPKMDLCLTSPPFMRKSDKWNPLYLGDPAKAGYDIYLKRLTQILKNLGPVCKKNAPVIIHVDNIPGKSFTPLVWDVGQALSKIMHPVGQTTILWDGAPDFMPISNLLIFRNSL
jgi:DNA modification methylase